MKIFDSIPFDSSKCLKAETSLNAGAHHHTPLRRLIPFRPLRLSIMPAAIRDGRDLDTTSDAIDDGE